MWGHLFISSLFDGHGVTLQKWESGEPQSVEVPAGYSWWPQTGETIVTPPHRVSLPHNCHSFKLIYLNNLRWRTHFLCGSNAPYLKISFAKKLGLPQVGGWCFSSFSSLAPVIAVLVPLTSSALEEKRTPLLLGPQDNRSKLWACEWTWCRQLIRKGREQYTRTAVVVLPHKSNYFKNKTKRSYLSIEVLLARTLPGSCGCPQWFGPHLMQTLTDRVGVQWFAAFIPVWGVIVC